VFNCTCFSASLFLGSELVNVGIFCSVPEFLALFEEFMTRKSAMFVEPQGPVLVYSERLFTLTKLV